MSTSPLELSESFNPKTHLLFKTTENGTFHESRAGARLAERLLGNGHPDDIIQAEKTLDATLNCQESHPDDPHYGNFYWMAEDDVVGDLNAVEFCLESLIPMMIDHGDRLSEPMRQRVLKAIRLGLDEVRRINVRVTYSNITALDILNTCLGGELLNDPAIAQRGCDKLEEWMAYTDSNGTDGSSWGVFLQQYDAQGNRIDFLNPAAVQHNSVDDHTILTDDNRQQNFQR